MGACWPTVTHQLLTSEVATVSTLEYLVDLAECRRHPHTSTPHQSTPPRGYHPPRPSQPASHPSSQPSSQPESLTNLPAPALPPQLVKRPSEIPSYPSPPSIPRPPAQLSPLHTRPAVHLRDSAPPLVHRVRDVVGLGSRLPLSHRRRSLRPNRGPHLRATNRPRAQTTNRRSKRNCRPATRPRDIGTIGRCLQCKLGYESRSDQRCLLGLSPPGCLVRSVCASLSRETSTIIFVYNFLLFCY